ncbi:MAG: hypothetical protein JWQ71_4267 [Pedosphaera sp.]|nr:hypothetical protein [Pedosphaera sp.]
MIKKVRSSFELSNPPLNTSTLDSGTHPDPKTRLHIINNLECHPFNGDMVHDAYAKESELIYSISFNALCTYTLRDGSKVCKILSEMTTTAALGKSRSIGTLTLRTDKITHTLRSDGIVELDPMDMMGVSFTKTSEGNPDLAKGFTPRVDGISVEKIQKRTFK